jgi:hypothetical protein
MKNVRLVNRGPGVAFKIYYFNRPMGLLHPGATVQVLNKSVDFLEMRRQCIVHKSIDWRLSRDVWT